MQTPRLLLVCTANQCRSPMAAALLARAVTRLGVEAEVSSAGLLPGGVPAAAGAVAAMGRRGLSLVGHVSRQLEPTVLARADLVVTMERRHVQAVAAVDPAAWPRVFPCKPLLHRAEQVGARAATEPFHGWVAALSTGRQAAHVLAGSRSDDVFDPIGGPARQFEAVADELDVLMQRLATLAFVPGTLAAPSPPAAGSNRRRRRPWRLRRRAS